jgi:hypothetical protein
MTLMLNADFLSILLFIRENPRKSVLLSLFQLGQVLGGGLNEVADGRVFQLLRFADLYMAHSLTRSF